MARAFVELEGEANIPEEVVFLLGAFIKKLDVALGELVTCGYPHMLLDRDH